MQLIPNWRSALRMFSVQAQAVNLAGIGAWLALPREMQAAVPESVVFGLAMLLMALGIVGRLVAQPGIEDKTLGGRPGRG